MIAPAEQDHLIFKIIEYGLNSDTPRIFTLKQLIDELRLTEVDIELTQRLIANQLVQATPNHILYICDNPMRSVTNFNDYRLTLLPSAIVMYNEFEELKLANKNAKDAKIEARKAHRLAMLALWVSLGVGGIQITLQLIDMLKK